MGAKWVNHKGKKILYQDYRGESDAEMMETLNQTEKMMLESPGLVLSVSNVENCSIAPAFMEKSKALGKTVFHQKVAKSCMVGITGLKQILYNAYTTFANPGHPVKACSTEAEALDWLVS